VTPSIFRADLLEMSVFLMLTVGLTVADGYVNEPWPVWANVLVALCMSHFWFGRRPA